MSGRPLPDGGLPKARLRDPGSRGAVAPRSGDTFAWLLAAASVIGPILLILVASVSLAYGLIHLFFLR